MSRNLSKIDKDNENLLGQYLQKNAVLTTLRGQIKIPYQSSQKAPNQKELNDHEIPYDAIQDLEIFSQESIQIQNFYIDDLNKMEFNSIRIQFEDKPHDYQLFSKISSIIFNKKSISKVHLKFHYQMEEEEIKVLDQIMSKRELSEFKLTLENNQITTQIFTLLAQKLKDSIELKSFSLEILNYSVKSKDSYLLSEGIRQNKSLREIEIVSFFLIHGYEQIVESIGKAEQIEVVRLDLTYSTDYVSDVLVQIGQQIVNKLTNLKEIYISFYHYRIIENESITQLLECIYQSQSIQTIHLFFPFTTFDINQFQPFQNVGKRKSPIHLLIDFRITTDYALDYLLQIFRLNYFKSIDFKSIKNIHMRSGKLLNSQIMVDPSLERLNFSGSYNDLVMLEEGLKQSQISNLSLAIKYDIIDFPKLRIIGKILSQIPRLSTLNLVFNDCTFDVKHLNTLIVQKLQDKPLLTFMRLTLFKFSSKQDQLIQFFEENINSRVILDIYPHNYTMQDPILHIINVMAKEQIQLISKIQYFNINIAPHLHYNPLFIFADLYLD